GKAGSRRQRPYPACPASSSETAVSPPRRCRLRYGSSNAGTCESTPTLLHSVDSYEPFFSDLVRRAWAGKAERLVQTHCMDMKDIPQVFADIDLLWSEGAAYNFGFANALATWAPSLSADGFAVIS